MKVIFSHGKESGPWGSKITALAKVAEKLGVEVESIDYTETFDPDRRVEMLTQSLERTDLNKNDIVLAGSSMGGYVSAVGAERFPVKGLFLMAPAFFIPGYDGYDFKGIHCPIMVVHGWGDEIIPYQNSIRFAQERNANLVLVDSDHALKSAQQEVADYFQLFLLSILKD